MGEGDEGDGGDGREVGDGCGVGARRAGRSRLLTGGPLVFVAVATVYVLSPVDLGGYDPKLASLAAHSLVHERDLDLDEFPSEQLVGHPLVLRDGDGAVTAAFADPARLDAARSGAGVHVQDYFPWPAAVAATPAVVVADAEAALFGRPGSRERVGRGDLNGHLRVLASLLVAGAAVAVWALARRALGRPGGLPGARADVGAALVAAAFAFGTTAWSTASRGMWQHTVSLPLVAVGLGAALRAVDGAEAPGVQGPGGGRERDPGRGPWGDPVRAGVAGVALAAATVVRPTNLVVAAAVAAWLLVAGHGPALGRRVLVPFGLGAAAVVAGALAAGGVLLGDALPPYYRGRLVLHDELTEALAAQWVSPSRGLLWASPFVLLAVPGAVIAWRRGGRRERALVAALGGAVVGVTLSVSAFGHWWAGHSYGPRFMTEALVPLLVLGLPAVERLVAGTAWPRRRLLLVGAVAAVAAWSVLAHGSGATRTYGQCWNAHPDDVDARPERIWDLRHNQLAFAVKGRLAPGAPQCELPG